MRILVNSYKVSDNTVTIILTNGVRTLIDREDFHKVWGLNWSLGSKYVLTGSTGFKQRSLHRVIMNLPKRGKDRIVDHINGDVLDNRKNNLRVVSYKENNRNRTKIQGTQSKFKGVRRGRGSRWRAYIYPDGKAINLGTFKTEEAAAKAYNDKALEIYGYFAKLNVL